ncbi:replicase-associated polyprotein [Oat blue dwarf virus]|uniref:Replicase-associated polyprotein n=2 Tax=Oat blue dwarf virus TaxID=56879 RepID=P89920_9VIRU|nr:replicase-associated polyprotein [Oat blue dwarf virus]AAC57874.1 replicase-associated polyprotein [Oat blue dwarf virus]
MTTYAFHPLLPTPTSFATITGGGLKDVIETLSSTIHRDTIAAPLMETLASPYRDSLRDFPWAVPASALPFLQECGITVAGHGFKAHPHPVHKTIETHLLHKVWPHYAQVPSSVLFMKPSKFAKLQRGNANFSALHNYRLTAKDTPRYPNTSTSLPDTETAFMHDALMYYTPAQIVDLFLSCPKLEKLYASLVVPPESSFTSISLHPDLYRFRFDGDRLIYELEGNPAHNYTQPRSALDWLRTTTIRGPGVSLTVSRLDSWGPCHSLLIQRGIPPMHAEHDSISFRGPRAVAIPEPSSLHQDLRHRLVPEDVYNALFLYVRAVRTLRVTDPAGFVRTQCSKPEYAWVTSSAWDNLAHFALLTAPHRPRTSFYLFSSTFQRLEHWVRHHTFLLAGLTTAFALPPSAWLANLVARASASHIQGLALARRWLITPPHLFRPPPPPSFALLLQRNSTGPVLLRGSRLEFEAFPSLAPQLARRFPFLARLLPQKPIDPWVVASLAVAVAIPAASLAVRWFFGPDTPQAMHDRYHTMFHPREWRLTLPRGPISCGRSSFSPLPHPPSPTPAPDSRAEPLQPPSAPPSTHEPAPADLEPQAPPAHAPQTEPPSPVIEQEARPNPLPAPAPLSAPTPSASAPSLAPTPSAPEPPSPTASEQAASLIPAPSSALVVEPSGVVSASSWGATNQPADQVDDSPLARDPSASGPVRFYRDLFPANYAGDSGTFDFRARASGRSPTPYPAMDCLLVATEQATRISREALWDCLTATCPDSFLDPKSIAQHGLSTDHFVILAHRFSLCANFHSAEHVIQLGMADATSIFMINHTAGSAGLPGHFSLRLGDQPRALNGGLAQDLAVAALRFNISGDLLPTRSVHTYRSWPKRAKNLVSNMKNGFDGVMASINPIRPSDAREKIVALDGLLDIARPRSVRLIHIAGFPGCGKTHPITKLLHTAAFRDFKLAVPTTELRSEWKELMKLSPSQAWRFGTWESSLLKSARILVIDEIYKLPRGYLDLAIHSDSSIEFVIALGDPLQGEYHSTHPSSSNSRLIPEVSHLAPYLDYYCLWSYRVPQDVAAFFQVQSHNPALGFARLSKQFPTTGRVLTNSQNSMLTMTQCGYSAVTIASSQGSTYSGATHIHLDRNSSLLSPSNSLVALTRSRTGVFFSGDPALLNGGPNSNLMFSAFFQGKSRHIRAWFPTLFPTATLLFSPLRQRHNRLTGALAPAQPSHLLLPDLPSLPPLPASGPYSRSFPVRSRFAAAVKPSDRSDVLSWAPIAVGDGETNAPRIDTSFLPETRRPLHFDLPSFRPQAPPPPSDPAPSGTAFEPVYPGETFENLVAHFLPAHDPTDREIHWRRQLSNQFPHVDKEYHLAAQPMTLLAPIHDSKHDPTLLAASIQKRLRFRPSASPYRISPRDELLGQLLYESLCRAYHRSPTTTHPFDEALFVECIDLNEFAQLTSKTQAVIMGNARRSDPDWRWSAVRIFSKTQHKVNEGSIFGAWKACQTLALMHDAVVLLLGPVKKYQRVFDARDRPAHLYIHAGQTPSSMSLWCQTHLTPAVKLANDYTAFDQSQHGEAVVLERKKMERLSIPDHLISLHVHLKTHVETQFGPLTCMRLTGEPGTYDDNTDYNLAVINLEYAAAHVPTMVSGDDSLLDFEPPRRPEWVAIEPLLALRFKKERGLYATFCGYYASRVGCVRSPIALFAKLAIAVDDSSISDKLAAYLMEFAVGHSLGDSLWSALPLSAVPFQSACFDFFCRRAPRDLKLALHLGEVPETIIQRLSHLSWLSHAVYSLLPSRLRLAILHSSRQHRSLPEDPAVSSLQGELLQTFHAPMPSLPSLPLFGGLSPDNILTPHEFRTALYESSAYPTPPNSPTSMSGIHASQVGPPPASDDRTDRQPSLPLAPRIVESSLAVPHVDVPFQWAVASYAGDSAKFLTDDLSGSSHLSRLTIGYRHAELISAELEFAPLAAAFAKPISVTAVWTIASIAPATTTELQYYGGRLLTLGGPVLMGSVTRIPADLTRLNPVIKTAVGFTDCPRFTYSVYANGGSANTPLITVMVRGVIRLSGPSGNTVTAT